MLSGDRLFQNYHFLKNVAKDAKRGYFYLRSPMGYTLLKRI